MYPSQQLFVQHRRLAAVDSVLVAVPGLRAGLGHSIENAFADSRRQAEERAMHWYRQAEQHLDRCCLGVAERALGFYQGQPARNRDFNLHVDQRGRLRSGFRAGASD